MMKTLTKSNGLWTGSLQKHMAVSRREMNKSYGLQQAQLARMNIVRDSQRLQLSAADTLVRLDNLKAEIKKNEYKPPPKVGSLQTNIVPYGDLYDEAASKLRAEAQTNSKSILNNLISNIGIVPNSNPALMNTIIPYGDPYDEEEEREEKPTLEERVALETANRAKAKAEAKAKAKAEAEAEAKAEAEEAKSNFKNALKKLNEQIEKYPSIKDSTDYKLLLNKTDKVSRPKTIDGIENKIKKMEKIINSPNLSLLTSEQSGGDGLGRMRKRGKSGRFISKR